MKYNKGNTVIVVLVVVVLALLAWWLYDRSQSPSPNSPEEGNQEQTSGAKGKVYFSVTDAAADMGNVTAIDMTVSKVEMHSATEGWVTASSDTQTFDLLELKAKGESQLAASADVAASTYDQMRVTIDRVSVTTKDGTSKTAKVPSGELKLMSNVVVIADKTSSVNLDFIADASLHTTGKGEYVFAPVVKVDSRSDASVEIGSNSRVSIGGGKTESSGDFGMDLDGQVKSNFKLDSKAKIDLDASGLLKLQGGSAGASLNQNTGVESGAKVEIY
jgi:cytoskeletal protein RodZ